MKVLGKYLFMSHYNFLPQQRMGGMVVWYHIIRYHHTISNMHTVVVAHKTPQGQRLRQLAGR